MNMQNLKSSWEILDKEIRGWWDADLRQAQEAEIRDKALNAIWYSDDEHRAREQKNDPEYTLLFLPFPYVSGGGSEAAFPEMYCWDSFFVNLGLIAHERFDLVRQHILNHLFMIQRYGFVLTGNRTYYLSRSQTPLLAESVRRYHQHHPDRDLLCQAYPLLKYEYHHYWLAAHHQTPTGLVTNRDLGDERLRPELAAEAEVTDFTACFDGDVRRCNPLQTNCALVQYAHNLAWMAEELGWREEADAWRSEARQRSARILELCWDESQGFFFEYQFEQQKRLPYWSLGGYWAMWAGVATPQQAQRLVKNLQRFEHDYGLAQTAEAYPSPHPEFEWLQWNYPTGWPPMQLMVIEGLERYGYAEDAARVARKFLTMMIELHQSTGKLWEKYNVVEGNTTLPRERYVSQPLHGWSCAAVVLLGRRV